MVDYLKSKFDKKYGPSCTCGDINCICYCESGGLDGEGNTTNQPCFDIDCKQHGSRCKVKR